MLKRIFEWPWLMLLGWGNHFWNLGIWIQEVRRYYWLWPVAKADIYWMLEYGLRSPFAISRRATRKNRLPEDLAVYGETPWTTLERICEAAQLRSEQRFVDLGCGTGRTLLFVSIWYGCNSLGYELVERFVEKFAWLQHKLNLKEQAQIKAENWLDAELEGDVFLLVGSCYSDRHLQEATHKLQHLPPGKIVVSVSYPIAGLTLQEEFEAAFSWGKGTVYVQQTVQQA